MKERRGTLTVPLPTRNGVGPSRTCLPAGDWQTIAQCLIEHFSNTAASEWMRRIGAAEVVDGAGTIVTSTRAHEPGAIIFYYRTIEDEPRIPFEETVLFQDEHIIVADKPHFLPVIPGGRFLQETLLVRLKGRLGIDSLVPIHRIDGATAGLVVFSVQERTRGAYQALFRERAVEKHYEAIALHNDALRLPMVYESRVVQDEHFMRMREVAGEPNARTTIALIEKLESAPSRREFARYLLSPTTGRKHQLRVQCAALGIPIVNDPFYPVLRTRHQIGGVDDFAHPLQLLAREIAFRDPITLKERRFKTLRTLVSASAAL